MADLVMVVNSVVHMIPGPVREVHSWQGESPLSACRQQQPSVLIGGLVRRGRALKAACQPVQSLSSGHHGNP